MCPTPLQPRRRPPMVATYRDPQLASAGLGQLTLIDVYQGLEPQVARGQVKYLRVCEEVRAELARAARRPVPGDHESFQDWYATPIHKVSGPNGWPSYVAKASLGLVQVSQEGSAQLHCASQPRALFRGVGRAFQRTAADAQRSAVAAGRAAQLHWLPRAATRRSGRTATAHTVRPGGSGLVRATVGCGAVLLRTCRAAGVECPLRLAATTRRTSRA